MLDRQVDGKNDFDEIQFHVLELCIDNRLCFVTLQSALSPGSSKDFDSAIYKGVL